MREKLQQQLKSLDETIAYKKSKLAELKDLLAYKLAQAAATTGDEQAQWLALADGVRAEIDQWTGYLNELLKQRAELVSKINALPATDQKACASNTTTSCADLAQQLKAVDDAISYKLQKFSDAKAAGDEEAAQNWLNLIRELYAQRSAIVAKIAALK
jgi:chromosome segregation ATPase